MDDEVFWLFVLVASMITLSIPLCAQPVFAVFVTVLSVLAGRAAMNDEVSQTGQDLHQVTDR